MAVHPLVYQETECCQPAGPPPLHQLGNTYDLALSFAIEYTSSTSTGTPVKLRDQVSMVLKEHSSTGMERSSNSSSRTSFGLNKRSVAGMKSLLPLKLLSPTVPQHGIWPSSETVKRSTFGTNIIPRDPDQSSDVGDRARDSLESRKRSRQYRDTPIYNQPGSPIPSRAYFSDDEMSFNCSQPGSICGAERLLQDFAILNANEPDDEVEDVDDQEGNAQQSPCTVRNRSRRHSEMRTPRWSELSFQCSGEVTYQNESIWLEGPKNITKPVGDRMPDEQQTVLPARMVESWLSDTSSSFEHEEEIPACATALSPSRAHVIDHSPNTSPPPGLLPIHIPARSSSLMGTSNTGNSYWDTSGTPPLTPSGWSGEPEMLPYSSQGDAGNVTLPKLSLGLSAPSPPLSPHQPPINMATATNQWPKKRAAICLSNHDLDKQRLLPLLHPSQPSLTDIISSLEASTSSFPSSILHPNTPCIYAIRSREVHHVSPPAMPHHSSLSPLRTPFAYEFPRPPSSQPTGRPKSFKFPSQQDNSLSSNLSNSMPDNISTMRSPSLPTLMPPSGVCPPNLTPLRRIFPKTSDFMRSTLYAHIIAHNFVVSQAAPMQRSPTNSTISHRRDTPQWISPLSPKAANVLGIALQDSNPTGDSTAKQLQFRIRLQALQQTLRQCIYCLTSVMDSDVGIEDVPELDDNTLGCSNGKLFIRTLEEVVKSCEAGIYGLGGMV